MEVLLIDDDEEASELIALLLKRAGYSVARAANGLEGLALLELVRPELILLDVHMPVMDGPQFREAQRRDARLLEIPTVVMSSDREAEMVLDPNIAATIPKPASFEAILGVVEQHCHPH